MLQIVLIRVRFTALEIKRAGNPKKVSPREKLIAQGRTIAYNF